MKKIDPGLATHSARAGAQSKNVSPNVQTPSSANRLRTAYSSSTGPYDGGS